MVEKQNVNAAHRLYLLIQAAVSKDPKLQQIQVWASVFGLEQLSGRQQKQQVARGIDLIYDQLDRVLEYVKGKQFPPSAYQELQTKIEQNISPELMHHQWENFRSQLVTQTFPLAILSATPPTRKI